MLMLAAILIIMTVAAESPGLLVVGVVIYGLVHIL